MVGFGPTVWSRERGDTEYGLKAIPLGGYIRMIGMFPPSQATTRDELRESTTGPFQALGRGGPRVPPREEIRPGDEGRDLLPQAVVAEAHHHARRPVHELRSSRSCWSTIVLVGIGMSVPTTTVDTVPECVIPVPSSATTCEPGDEPSPGGRGRLPARRRDRGLRRRSRLTTGARSPKRSASDGTVDVTVVRDGQEVALQPHPDQTQRLDPDDADARTRRQVGYLGVGCHDGATTGSPVERGRVRRRLHRTTRARPWRSIPQRMVGVWQAAFGGEERDTEAPVGIVGAGRIGGEIASLDADFVDRLAGFLSMLVASFNMASRSSTSPAAAARRRAPRRRALGGIKRGCARAAQPAGPRPSTWPSAARRRTPWPVSSWSCPRCCSTPTSSTRHASPADPGWDNRARDRRPRHACTAPSGPGPAATRPARSRSARCSSAATRRSPCSR